MFTADRTSVSQQIYTEMESYAEVDKVREVSQPATEVWKCCGFRFLVDKKLERKPRTSYAFLVLLTTICAFSAMQYGGAVMNQRQI